MSTPNDNKACSELYVTKDSENPPGGHDLLMMSAKGAGRASES